MLYSFEELRKKEVIDIRTGERLGFIDDVRLDTDSSEITALLIYGRWRLFGSEEGIEIPCRGIRVIGRDIILIENSLPLKLPKKHKECF